MSLKIPVELHVNNRATYTGDFEPLQIVHEALVKLMPPEELTKRRISIKTVTNDLIYADMFLGEIFNHYGHCALHIFTSPLTINNREWRQVGFDHLALSVQDRARARDFFHLGLKMDIARDDDHITVLTTGNTALFFFAAEPGQPLTDGIPSRIHHLGFVVDDLEAAYSHIQLNFPEFASEFTLLERLERWSLYGRLTIGQVTFMLQLSQIKDKFRGFPNPQTFTDIMYNYRSRPYGVRFQPDE